MSKRIAVVHAYPSRYLLDALAAQDARVVLVGAGAALAGHAAVEAVLEVDLGDAQAVRAAVRAHHDRHPLDALLPVYEGGVPLTAQIAEELGLVGVAPATALASRNKYISQLLWQSLGIATPKTLPLPAPLLDWPDIAEQLGGRAVIKLVDSMNSQGVALVANEDDYRRTVRRLLAMVADGRDADAGRDRNRFAYGRGELKLIAQSFCGGAEVGVDVFLDGADSHVMGIFEKQPSHGPFFAESMSISPTGLGASAEAELGEIAIRAARALGARVGAAHVEIRYDEQGPKVLEAGLRPGGAYTVMAIERMRGVNVYGLLARQFSGAGIGPIAPARGALLYGGIVYPRSGVLGQVRGESVFGELDGVVDVQILNRPGDRVFALPESAQPHFCYYLLEGRDRDSVVERHRRIQSTIGLSIE